MAKMTRKYNNLILTTDEELNKTIDLSVKNGYLPKTSGDVTISLQQNDTFHTERLHELHTKITTGTSQQ
jgi:hypothetical protein